MRTESVFIAFTCIFVAVMVTLSTALPSIERDTTTEHNVTIEYDAEMQAYEEMLARQDIAYKNFLERNNFHQIRISEYEKYWGDPSTDQRLEQILEDIKKERLILEEFDPAMQSESQWSEIRDNFRQTNDLVVTSLVEILLEEYDYHTLQIPHNANLSLTNVAESLAAQKTIASQITATSFPATDNITAELARTIQDTGMPTREIVPATVHLGEQTEHNITILEENGINTRERYDVREVGPEKNTMQVLFSVIKCQQELRIDAEEYMDASIMANMMASNFVVLDDVT
ncbi:MAG: hypothetical protein OXC46_08860 [Thaumarchaeota archaeon]|nr:hypothetical protein [Nitrososphaerota archaeon]